MSSVTSVYVQSSLYQEDYVATSTYAAEKPTADPHYDLVSFLTVIQRFNISILPVMWNALKAFSQGATSAIYQSHINIALELAFKRTSNLFRKKGETIAFQILISKIMVLGTRSIRNHPNIVDLEGICWELDDHENLSPVLVFQKAQYGDLARYLTSTAGKESSFETRLSICVDIGNAIGALYRSSKCSNNRWFSFS